MDEKQPHPEIAAILLGRFLDEKKAGKQPNIEELLEQCPENQKSQLRKVISLIDVSATEAPAAPLEAGFEILRQIGRGGFGTVFEAIDRALMRRVALKTVSDDFFSSSNSRQRFLTEARALASIDHPNVLKIYSIDEHLGRIRLSLEFIEGCTLESIVEENGPMAPEEAARIGIELCKALGSIHAKGILHRDLKPSNVMRADGGRIVLLDFGLASSTGSQRGKQTELAGTPIVMAPEQIAGTTQIGPRTDLFALGVLLYWLVSKHFPAENASTMEELKSRILRGDFVPLSDLRQDLPEAFLAIIHRAISILPENRYPTAGSFEQALREYISGQSKPRNNRLLFVGTSIGIATFAALLGSSMGIFPWSSRHLNSRSFSLESQFRVVRNETSLPLFDGDAIRVGDKIVLEVEAQEPLFVYVFNEDNAGNVFTLFPLPDGSLQNPLPKGKTTLPGTGSEADKAWVVNSPGGGSETLLLVASLNPMPAAIDLCGEIPSAKSGAPLQFSSVSTKTKEALYRGIGGMAQMDRSLRRDPKTEPKANSLSEIFRSAKEKLIRHQDTLWQVLRLRNES